MPRKKYNKKLSEHMQEMMKLLAHFSENPLSGLNCLSVASFQTVGFLLKRALEFHISDSESVFFCYISGPR